MVLLCWLLLVQWFSQARGEILVDMSYDLAEDSATWANGLKFKKTEVHKGYSPQGVW